MSISVSLSKVSAAVAGLVLAFALATTASAQTTSCYTFTLNHKLGNTGGEVMSVQKFLNMNAATQVAASGAGSTGQETTRFGGLTKAAVMKFQAANGVSPVSGYWGPLTRAKANALEAARCSSTGPVVVVPGTGDAVVAAAPQPGNSLAPAGAARVPFTKFTVTAGANPVTLNSVTVERGGLAADAAFANVVLLDSMGNQLGTEKVLNSNHQATVGSAVVIPAGTTKTFTVAANMATNTLNQAGQVAVFSVVSANTSGTVAGSLPITGAQHTVNASLALGQATVDRGPLDPISAVTKEIGTTGYTFASYKVTAGSAEKIRVWGIRVNQAGSVAGSDLANLKMTVDGVDYVPTWSADGKYAQFNFGSGIVVDKGLVKEFSVKGDIVGGSGRTISMDIYRLTDIQVTGETYGYGITPTAAGSFSSTANPAYNAGDVTVNAGTFNSVQKSASAAAANIGKQKANEILGAFTVDLKGEKVQVQTLKMDLTVDAGSTSRQITNVTLVDQAGAVLAGPVDSSVLATSGGNNANALTFSAVTFPAGATTVYVKGQLDSNWVQDDTVTVITTPSTQWTGVTGDTSGNNVSLASLSAPISANTMTVKAAALVVNTLTQPSAQTVVKGSGKHHFATIRLDASNSGEDVRVSNLTLTDTAAVGGAVTNIDNVELWADLTSANNADTRMGAFETRVKSAEQFTAATLGIPLDTHITVPKNGQVNVGVFADVSSAEVLNATHTIKVDNNAAHVAAVGLTSGATVTSLTFVGSGQLMTIANTGTLVIALAPSSPATKLVTGNVAGVDLAILKLRAENEDVDLQQLKLKLTSGAAASLAGNSVMVYDGATKVGEATFNASTATVYFTPNFRAPKGADKNLTLKADLSAIGTNQSGVAGSTIKVDFDGDTAATASTKGVGAASGTTVVVSTDVAPTSADTTSNGVITFKSIPTVARVALPATNNLVNGTTDLFRFSVKADAAGDVSVYKVSVNSTGTGVTYTAATAKVIAYTDAGFSTPISGSFASGEVLTGATIDDTGAADANLVFSSPVTIPAGQTYYFKVVVDVAGVDAAGDSVSTKLLGDAAPVYTSVVAAAAADADANDDFIWSGNSTGTPVAATVDWYNGYTVVGLPASDTDASTNTRAN